MTKQVGKLKKKLSRFREREKLVVSVWGNNIMFQNVVPKDLRNMAHETFDQRESAQNTFFHLSNKSNLSAQRLWVEF